MDKNLFKQSEKLRMSVLTGMSLFLSSTALLFAVFHLVFHAQYVTAFFEGAFSLCSGVIYTFLKQGRCSRCTTIQYAYLLIGVLILVTTIRPLDNAVYIWTCSAPLMLYLLLGVEHALKTTGVFLIIQVSIIIIKQQGLLIDTLPLTINLSLCYIGIWIISHLYETNRVTIENSLLYLASRDTLTGAHNRLALTSSFNHYVTNEPRNTGLWLVILDIDLFKQINDQHGHDIGDKVLIETTVLLAEEVGEENLFRIGGEEFCITLFDSDLDQAQKIGEELRKKVANNLYHFGSKRIQLTLSIGICQYQPGNRLSEILKSADIELYKAKRNGRNQVCICTHECGMNTTLVESQNQSF